MYMSREGTGKFINRKSTTAGKKYDSFFFYCPSELARDTSFPFRPGDKVKFKMEGDKIIIEKA
jgi:hypothetical protein